MVPKLSAIVVRSVPASTSFDTSAEQIVLRDHVGGAEQQSGMNIKVPNVPTRFRLDRHHIQASSDHPISAEKPWPCGADQCGRLQKSCLVLVVRQYKARRADAEAATCAASG